MIRKSFEFLTLSNLFISACAASLVLQTYFLLERKIIFDGLVFVTFFSTLFIYCNHGRIAWLPFKRNEKSGGSPKYYFYKKFTLIAILGILISAFFCSFQEILLLIPLGLVSLLYSGPLISKNRVVPKLREVAFLKIFLIAFVWSCATVILPAINLQKTIFSYEVLMLLLRRMLFIFAITVPFDIRDLKADEEGKIKTLPIVFGLDAARSMSIGAMLFFETLVIFQYYISEGNIPLSAAFTISAAASLWLIQKPAGENKRLHYYLGLDGMMLLQFLLVLAASYV